MSDKDTNLNVEITGDAGQLGNELEKAKREVADFAKKSTESGKASEDAAKKTGSAWGGLAPIFGKVSDILRNDIAGAGIGALGQFGSVGAEAAQMISSQWDKLPAVFQKITIAAGAAAVAIAGAMAGKRFADATAEATEKTRDFARALGITTNEARVYQAALDDIGASESEFVGLSKGLARQLRENEDAMNKAGLVTRDAAGKLKPLNELTLDAVDALNKYTEGTDRAVAARDLFGRSADTSSRILMLNKAAIEENRQAVKDLHLEVGEASTRAWEDYDRASDRAALTMKGFSKAIGDSVMPAVTELTDWFNSSGPAAITVIRGALGGLSTAFIGLTNGLVILWEAFKAIIFTLTDPIVRLGEALTQLASGNVKAATQTMMDIPKSIGARWGMMWDEVAAASQRSATRIKNIWAFATGGDTATGNSGAVTGTKGAPTKGDKGKEEKPADSYMQYYEGMLSEERKAHAAMSEGRMLSKQEELAFWEFILATATTTEKDKVSILKKTSDLQVAVWREAAQQKAAIDQNSVEHRERMANMELAAAEANAQVEFQLGRLTKEQLLQAELDFEARRTAIRLGALQERMSLVDPDSNPVAYAQLKQQIEEVELTHQSRMAAIKGQFAVQSAQEQAAIWSDLSGRVGTLWDQGVNAMMNGTLRWSNAMRAIGGQLVGWFANSVVKPQVMQWLLGEQVKTGATQQGVLMRFAAEAWGAAKSVALWAATAVKNIMTSAWEAMAGAWKAIVGIPYVGPVLAPIAAGAAFAGVAALASNVVSAEGGYDIPAGVDPMVQAHAKEMILPAKYADVIRGAADGEDTGGGGDMTVELKGQRMKGNFFLTHESELVSALQSLQRNGKLRFTK